MVNAIAHIDIKTPWFAEQGFVAGAAAAMPVAGGLVLGIRLRFHNHPPQQLAIGLVLDQQAANQLRGNHLDGAGEERPGQPWEVLDRPGGYGSGLVRNGLRLLGGKPKPNRKALSTTSP